MAAVRAALKHGIRMRRSASRQGLESREASGPSGQVLVEQLDRGFEGHDQDDRRHQRCDRVQRSSHQPEETERPDEREREHRQRHQHPDGMAVEHGRHHGQDQEHEGDEDLLIARDVRRDVDLSRRACRRRTP